MSDALHALLQQARRRLLAMHYRAGVGHIGGNLSALPALMVLHHRVLQPEDRFVLSKGHAAGALYVTLWSRGLLGDADLDTFHAEGTRLPGHPPAAGIEQVRFATGSLGHGLSIAAGCALAARLCSIERSVYCLTSDGEWQEGATWEALLFAAHHRLTGLTILVDCNRLQGFGTTAEVASLEPLGEKIGGFGVTVVQTDGADLAAIGQALRAPCTGPRVVLLHTRKGEGVSFMHDRLEWHYLAMSEQQYRQALAELADEPR